MKTFTVTVSSEHGTQSVTFESITVEARNRKLEGTWTFEMGEPIWDCSDEWREMMEMEIDPNIKN